MNYNVRFDYPKETMETKTTRTRLNKTPENAPQVLCSVRENISPANLKNTASSEDSVSCFHWGSGNNSRKRGSISARVFVLGVDGKPLTPYKYSKARKLLKGKQAIPPTDKSVGILASDKI